MDWSELNEKFVEFDELCESLFKMDLNKEHHQTNQLKIDITTDNNLFSYSLLMPNQLKPISYSNITTKLIDEFLNDEWFRTEGTLLRTLEKGVFHPVLHFSSILNKKDDDFIQLFKTNKFGKNYTLYQAIYEELNVIELPVVTRKKMKNNSINKTVNITIDKLKYNNNNLEMIAEDDKLFDCSIDFSSTDSGCVSLNSTTNDYYSSNETKTKDSHNSMESLNSSYDSSNDSMLNSLDSQNLKKDDELDIMSKNDCSNASKESTKNISKNIQINTSIGPNESKIITNLITATTLNDGHIVIGFRNIKDKFFQKVFESNWQEMSGIRLLYPITASKFGLKKIRFLKRVALNSERQGRTHDDGTTFNYILHAEFLNLTNKNEIYLSNFVHRLRLRSLGSITFYTNLN